MPGSKPVRNFQGIGARIDERDGLILIHSVFNDSPAQNVGLKSGDIIIAVDGTQIEGDTVEHTALRIRGQAGTDVVLTIKRGEDEPFDVTITRAEVVIPSLTTETLSGNVGYIRLWSFGALTADELHDTLQAPRRR